MLRGVGLCVSVTAAALVLAPAASAERFASPGGMGSAATCPSNDPCDIQTAIESAFVTMGEVITVLPGDYNLAAAQTLVPFVDPVTIRGQPGAARPRIIVADAALDVGPSTAVRDLYIESTAGSPTVSADGATLERLEVRATDPASGAVFLENGAVFRDSFASTNRDGAAADTVRVLNGGATVANVTAIGLGDGADGVVADPVNQTVTVRNVIARGSGAMGEGIRVESAAMMNLDVVTSFSNYSSFIEAEPEGDFIDGGGNQTAAPLFVNGTVAVRDFHQVMGSPTRNAGSPFGLTGLTDIDGQTRIMGAGLDIGGDEFFEVPPAAPAAPAAPAKKKKKCKKKKKKRKRSAAAAKKRCKKKKR